MSPDHPCRRTVLPWGVEPSGDSCASFVALVLRTSLGLLAGRGQPGRILRMPRFPTARAVDNRGHESAGGKAHRSRGRLVGAVVRRRHRGHGTRARRRLPGRPLRLGRGSGALGGRGGGIGQGGGRRRRPGSHRRCGRSSRCRSCGRYGRHGRYGRGDPCGRHRPYGRCGRGRGRSSRLRSRECVRGRGRGCVRARGRTLVRLPRCETRTGPSRPARGPWRGRRLVDVAGRRRADGSAVSNRFPGAAAARSTCRPAHGGTAFCPCC